MLLSLLATAASAMRCAPVDGFAEVLAASQARWIVAGEMHGTNEMPAMFAALVCLASRAAHIVVAVEQPEQDQPAIDAYLNSDGGEEAEAAFLRAAMWRTGQPDSVLHGRSRRAMFRLFRYLWEQPKHGRVVRVIAYEPSLDYKNGAFRMPWSNDKPVDQSDFEHGCPAAEWRFRDGQDSGAYRISTCSAKAYGPVSKPPAYGVIST